MSISFYYKDKSTEELHGQNAVEGHNDFPSKKELKNTIKAIFKNYTCPKCGGHRIDGDKVVVEIGKVSMFKEEQKKGFFGSKFVDKHEKDVYRVHNIYLESSGFLSSAGYLRCKSCKWEQKGAKGVKWLSLNDIANGRF